MVKIKKVIKLVSVILILSFLNSIAFAEVPAPSQVTSSDINNAREFLKTPEGKEFLQKPEIQGIIKETFGGESKTTQQQGITKPGVEETKEIKNNEIKDEGKKKEQPPEKAQKASDIESQFNRPEADISLSLFGYSLFRQAASTFAPVDNIPVGEEYVVGPGDVFTVTLWGISEGIFKVTVNSDGTIVLPKAGVIAVAGMSFGQLQEYLQNTMGRYFEGVNVALTMDKIRSINVYIVGEVDKPGNYSLSSLSTVYSALFAVGGPTKKGTLRNIQLIRNDRVIATIDLYDFLLKGDKKQDRRLESGDTIFVPMIGPVVGITGNVNRPAIFEIRGSARLKDILWLAGELTPTSDLNRIQIERLIAHEKRIVMDQNISLYQEDKKLMGFPVQDRDLIQVFGILPGVKNVVNLEGNVVKAGRYEWKEGMRLKDLFPKGYADLKPEPFEEYGYIVRLVPPDFHLENLSFNLKKLLEGDDTQNIPLQKMDTVRVFSAQEQVSTPYISISGYIRNPGNYAYKDNMTLKDLIYQAGNVPTDQEPSQYGYIERLVLPQKYRVMVAFDLEKLLKGDEANNLKLEKFDEVTLYAKSALEDSPSVTIYGNVRKPGTYSLTKDMTLKDLILKSGGLLVESYNEEVEVYRKIPKSDRAEYERTVVNLSKAWEGDPLNNIALQNFDRVNVRKIQDWYQGKVTINGQVKFPGEYPIMKGEKLSSVLERAGGYTDKAYLFGAVFTRAELKTLQESNLQKAIAQMENNILKQQLQSGNFGATEKQASATATYTEQLMDKLKQTKLEGRLVIKLSDLSGFKGSSNDIELKDGDSLNIPLMPDSVSVVGEVYSPAGILWQRDKNISYYLDKVGGTTPSGDVNNLYVVRADGSVISKSAGNLDLFWTRLSAGDVMIVPPRIEKPVDNFQLVKDFSRLVFEIVMTIAIVKSATK